MKYIDLVKILPMLFLNVVDSCHNRQFVITINSA